MKIFFKKIGIFLGIISLISIVATFSITTPTSAAGTRSDGTACPDFLGMTAWDCGVTTMDNEKELSNNIVTIASNILTDLSVIASYLVIFYVMWGGYLYMFSSGDPGKAAAGKKTLTHAFIGLAICISSYTIFGAIRIALIGNSNSLGECGITGTTCVEPGDLVINLIQWVAGMGGIVAAIFIVVGGWGYITSSGDPSKLQKAKSTILYALIGLAIVALTEVITAFISSTIRDANAMQTTTVIANQYKESPDHEIN